MGYLCAFGMKRRERDETAPGIHPHMQAGSLLSDDVTSGSVE
jgi:hypothetical protein